jgi:hypothetical protein
MAFNQTMTITIDAAGVTVSKQVTKSAGAQQNISEPVANGATDLEITFSLDVSALKMLYIVADKAMTLKTNSSSVPDDTITLVANEPVPWYLGSALTNPITVDITTNIFLTNASGANGTLTIYSLSDPTP